ncbi:DUF4391 domain-containing protein [Desemzia incerta]|uniref:DUF4391 domain-containing protein n=1 Tax=Desemzia incerta TaxID=82801 RepID=UPI003CFCD5A1
MNTDNLIKELGIPKAAIINRNFPKKMLYQNVALSSYDKELIQNGMSRLRWLGSIKETNTNIPKYEDDAILYEEIQYFLLEVNNQEVAGKIGKILFNCIPYPQVLIVSFEEKRQYQVALTRKNSLDTNLVIVEKIYVSPWESSEVSSIEGETFWYHYSNHKKTNLKEYYESLLAKLLINTFDVSPRESEIATKEVIQIFDEVQTLNEKIKKLMSLVKSEKQLNKRIELQLQLTQLKNKQKRLIATSEEIDYV